VRQVGQTLSDDQLRAAAQTESAQWPAGSSGPSAQAAARPADTAAARLADTAAALSRKLGQACASGSPIELRAGSGYCYLAPAHD